MNEEKQDTLSDGGTAEKIGKAIVARENKALAPKPAGAIASGNVGPKTEDGAADENDPATMRAELVSLRDRVGKFEKGAAFHADELETRYFVEEFIRERIPGAPAIMRKLLPHTRDEALLKDAANKLHVEFGKWAIANGYTRKDFGGASRDGGFALGKEPRDNNSAPASAEISRLLNERNQSKPQ